MIVDNEVRVEHELGRDGYPNSVRFSLRNDEVWEWEPTGDGGRMPHSPYAAGPYWREGFIRRRGDERKIRSSSAWMETYSQRLGYRSEAA